MIEKFLIAKVEEKCLASKFSDESVSAAEKNGNELKGDILLDSWV